jgi:anthranilate 1,2-dioxygenase small subunit
MSDQGLAVDRDTRDAVNDLFTDYAWRLDNERFEKWLDLFTETATYKAIPRENVAQNLPAALILCENKAMIRDRIVALQEANKYNLHTARHLIGNLRFLAAGPDELRVTANYALFQTNQDGQSRLFSVGTYDDLIVRDGGAFKFQDKVVIIDTASVPTLLAVPL